MNTKKIITVTEAKNAPNAPDLPLRIVIIISDSKAVIDAGIIAPCHNALSLELLLDTIFDLFSQSN